MNATLFKTESLVDDLFYSTSETPAPQDLFATAPMQAMWREFDRQREEEAYTSFEAAISERVLALKERNRSVGLGTHSRRCITPAMDRFVSSTTALWYRAFVRRLWQRGLLFLGAALMLMLAGFDLMGLLVLYAR